MFDSRHDPRSRFVVQSLAEFSFYDHKERAYKIDAQGNKYDPETRLPIRDDEGKKQRAGRLISARPVRPRPYRNRTTPMPNEQPDEEQPPEEKPDPKRFVRLNFGRNPTPESILKAIRQVLEETKDQRTAEGEGEGEA